MLRLMALKKLVFISIALILQNFHVQSKQCGNFSNTTFVLVHGASYGAWAWYKVILQLRSKSFGAVAIDLTAAGIDETDANGVATWEDMGKPLLAYIRNFTGPGKLTLVGHSLGGFFISMAMEAYPQKISSSIFVAAVTPIDGDNYLSTIPPSIPLKNDDEVLVYGDPKSTIPTSGYLRKDKLQSILMNLSPIEDVELSLMLVRPVPFRPLLERIILTKGRYGSIKRFYLRTMMDMSVTLMWQDFNLERNPGAIVFNITSDHAAFFSQPHGLSKLLIKAHYLTILSS